MKNIQITLETSKSNSDIDIKSVIPDEVINKYSEISFSLLFYPYSKHINSDDYNFLPYEEYAQDISSGLRSSYTPIKESIDKVFGFLLGIIIAFVFIYFKPSELVSVESIVSIFAAYTIGKEIWKDLDNFLMKASRGYRVSWRPEAFTFEREYLGTIQKFINHARDNRYHETSILPSKIDFVTQSNSKLVDLLYKTNDLNQLKGKSLRLLNIDFKDHNLNEINNNFMFSMQMVLTKRILFFNFNTEYFQALDRKFVNTIDKKGEWVKDKVMIRKTINIGRLKIYRKTRIENITLISEK